MGAQVAADAGHVGGILDGEFVDEVRDGCQIEAGLRGQQMFCLGVARACEGLVVAEEEAPVEAGGGRGVVAVADGDADGDVEAAEGADHGLDAGEDFGFGEEGAVRLEVGWEDVAHHRIPG